MYSAAPVDGWNPNNSTRYISTAISFLGTILQEYN
jgi:hypothetical protein